MTDFQKLVELASKAGAMERFEEGQLTLGWLLEKLSNFDPGMPCKYDTGENFGLSPVEFKNRPADDYQDAYSNAYSKTAYPSCYRGYYSDCTFNAQLDYEVSTVGHVIDLITNALGKTFCGYKGGVYQFTRQTLVWGSDTSWSNTGSSSMVVGVMEDDGICLILTQPENL